MIFVLICKIFQGTHRKIGCGLSHGTRSGECHGLSDFFHHISKLFFALSFGNFFYHGVKLDQTFTAESTFSTALLALCQKYFFCLVDHTAFGTVNSDHTISDLGICLNHQIHGRCIVQFCADGDGFHVCISYQISHFCTKRYFLKLTHFSIFADRHVCTRFIAVCENICQRSHGQNMVECTAAACSAVDDAGLDLDAILSSLCFQFFCIRSFFLWNIQIHFLCIYCQRCDSHTFHYFFRVSFQYFQQNPCDIRII